MRIRKLRNRLFPSWDVNPGRNREKGPTSVTREWSHRNGGKSHRNGYGQGGRSLGKQWTVLHIVDISDKGGYVVGYGCTVFDPPS